MVLEGMMHMQLHFGERRRAGAMEIGHGMAPSPYGCNADALVWHRSKGLLKSTFKEHPQIAA
jgi:hypothetical protein